MFLKNKNIIFKVRRSKVTDYAALTFNIFSFHKGDQKGPKGPEGEQEEEGGEERGEENKLPQDCK